MFQVLLSFKFLLPFPSGFRSEPGKEATNLSKKAFGDFVTEKSIQLIAFLEHYLRTVRKFHWTAGFCRVLNTFLKITFAHNFRSWKFIFVDDCSFFLN